MSINYEVLEFILIIASLVLLCYFGPRKYNKHIYLKYHIINPLKLKNSLTGTLIIFGLTIVMLAVYVLICSLFNIYDPPKWTNIILYVLEIFIVIIATLIASQDIFEIEHITKGEIAVGCFFGFTSMIFSILGILSIISSVNDKKKSNARKAADVAVAAYSIFSIKADLSESDIEKLIEKSKNNVEVKLIDPPENSIFAQNNEKIIIENSSINVVKGKITVNRLCILTNKRLIIYKSLIPIKLSQWNEDKKEFEIMLCDIKTIEKQKWGLGHVIQIVTKDGKENKIVVMNIDKTIYKINYLINNKV